MAYAGNATRIEREDSGRVTLTEGADGATYSEHYHVHSATGEEDAYDMMDDYLETNSKKTFTKFDRDWALDRHQIKLLGIDGTNDFRFDYTLVWKPQTHGAKLTAPDPRNGPIREGRTSYDMRTESLHINWQPGGLRGSAGHWRNRVKRYPDTSGNTIYSPDFNGAINWDGKQVRGVDILVPTFSFTERHFFSEELFIANWKAFALNLIAHTNSDPFRVFEPGEVLCMGITGTPSKTGLDMEFHFGVRPNVTRAFADPYDPDDSTQDYEVDLKGWQYVWGRYINTSEPGGGGGIAKPVRPRLVGLYVHDIYDESQFNQYVPVGDRV